MMDVLFIINSILFGIGLAMDAFSVSVANGLRDPDMPYAQRFMIAGTFGGFQTIMPFVGWICVHFVAETFRGIQPFIPWIALMLLSYIGIKMIMEGIRKSDGKTEELRGGTLFLQGVATSIDALSVGFTIAGHDFLSALTESLIIGIVTFVICMAGLYLGQRIGERLSGKAEISGGIILIMIGLKGII